MSRAVELVFLARRWRERERSNFCSKTIYTLYTLPFRRGRRYRSIPLPYPTATATLNYIFIPDAHFFPYSFLPFFLSRPHGTSGHEPLAAEYANKSLQCYSSNSKRPRIPRRRRKKKQVAPPEQAVVAVPSNLYANMFCSSLSPPI